MPWSKFCYDIDATTTATIYINGNRIISEITPGVFVLRDLLSLEEGYMEFPTLQAAIVAAELI